jgi:FkbM family methyltransferase
VEASPWIFAVLAENVRLNDLSNITLFNKAVYHTSGLHLSMFAPKEYFGKGSLKPVYTQEGEQVETMTIADILTAAESRTPDFIKVDVEGFEKSVFEGLPSFQGQTQKPKIIFEYDASTERSAGFEPGDAQKVLLIWLCQHFGDIIKHACHLSQVGYFLWLRRWFWRYVHFLSITRNLRLLCFVSHCLDCCIRSEMAHFFSS